MPRSKTAGRPAGGGGRHHNSSHRYNPPRGSAGILWTCEPGKEQRCLREGLQILQYYYNQQHPGQLQKESTANDTANASEHPSKEGPQILSLDDEIAMLKNQNKRGNKKPDVPFRVYETGCKGTVFVLFVDGRSNSEKRTADDKESSDAPVVKKQRIDQTKDDVTDSSVGHEAISDQEFIAAVTTRPVDSQPCSDGAFDADAVADLTCSPWEALPTVLTIFEDLQKEADGPASPPDGDSTPGVPGSSAQPQPSSHIPTSRFITRMIPMQGTCFADLDEIQSTVDRLLKQYCGDIHSKKQTFSVQPKRRCCDHLTRLQIITAIGEQVAKVKPKWTVDLRQPDYTIVVETCKTLVGISILPSSYLKVVGNFNLAEIRAKVGLATE
jgi:hypothetical protein